MSDSKAKHITQRTAVTGNKVGALVEMYGQLKVIFLHHMEKLFGYTKPLKIVS